jgi:DNA-binding NtrC family response regulator
MSETRSEVVPISLDDRVREFEAALIQWALDATGGNKSKAAALLRIKRSTLGDRIKRCGLGNPATEPAREAANASRDGDATSRLLAS